MFRFGFNVYVLTILFLVGAAAVPSDSHAELSRKQLREIETDFLPAYEQGETWAMIKSLDRLMRQMSEEQVAEFDLMLQQQQIPKATHLMVQARMEVLETQPEDAKKLPRYSWQELSLTVSESESQIASITDQVTAHQAALDATADQGTFEQFESLIWDAHVLEQKLDSSIRLANYLSTMVERMQFLAKQDLKPEQSALLRRDFSDLEKQLTDTLTGVRERDLVARIKRLTHARKVLDTSDELKDRYLAAWSVDFDGPLVMEQLQQSVSQEDFHTDMLNDDQLPSQLDQTIKAGMAAAGELLLTKSRHLFTGLHWWTRGRYGMGPEAMGLLKSKHAVSSDAALFPLLMPEEMPDAKPPQEDWLGGLPEYDRRHQFIWAWEYRSVVGSSKRTKKDTSTTSSHTQVTSETQLSRFY